MAFISKRCQAHEQPGMNEHVFLGQRQPVIKARPRSTRAHANLPACVRGLCALEGFAQGLPEILGHAIDR
jgi:hypothetical protein